MLDKTPTKKQKQNHENKKQTIYAHVITINGSRNVCNLLSEWFRRSNKH